MKLLYISLGMAMAIALQAASVWRFGLARGISYAPLVHLLILFAAYVSALLLSQVWSRYPHSRPANVFVGIIFAGVPICAMSLACYAICLPKLPSSLPVYVMCLAIVAFISLRWPRDVLS